MNRQRHARRPRAFAGRRGRTRPVATEARVAPPRFDLGRGHRVRAARIKQSSSGESGLHMRISQHDTATQVSIAT